MGSPVAFCTVRTASLAPPREYAELILWVPLPGMSTQLSRGRLTTVTFEWSSERWITIIVSLRCPTSRPRWSWFCCRRDRSSRLSTPTSRMFIAPRASEPTVPALTRLIWLAAYVERNHSTPDPSSTALDSAPVTMMVRALDRARLVRRCDSLTPPYASPPTWTPESPTPTPESSSLTVVPPSGRERSPVRRLSIARGLPSPPARTVA